MEPEYYVLDGPSRYGPANVQILNQWAMEGRILQDTKMQEASTGRTLNASEVPGLSIPQQMGPPSPGLGQTQAIYQQPNPYATPPQPTSPYLRPGSMPDSGLEKRVSTALVLGLVSLLFCCIGGIVSTVLAANAQSALKRGDYLAAEDGSQKARAWAIASFIIGGIGWIGRVIALISTLGRHPF